MKKQFILVLSSILLLGTISNYATFTQDLDKLSETLNNLAISFKPKQDQVKETEQKLDQFIADNFVSVPNTIDKQLYDQYSALNSLLSYLTAFNPNEKYKFWNAWRNLTYFNTKPLIAISAQFPIQDSLKLAKEWLTTFNDLNKTYQYVPKDKSNELSQTFSSWIDRLEAEQPENKAKNLANAKATLDSLIAALKTKQPLEVVDVQHFNDKYADYLFEGGTEKKYDVWYYYFALKNFLTHYEGKPLDNITAALNNKDNKETLDLFNYLLSEYTSLQPEIDTAGISQQEYAKLKTDFSTWITDLQKKPAKTPEQEQAERRDQIKQTAKQTMDGLITNQFKDEQSRKKTTSNEWASYVAAYDTFNHLGGTLTDQLKAYYTWATIKYDLDYFKDKTAEEIGQFFVPTKNKAEVIAYFEDLLNTFKPIPSTFLTTAEKGGLTAKLGGFIANLKKPTPAEEKAQQLSQATQALNNLINDFKASLKDVTTITFDNKAESDQYLQAYAQYYGSEGAKNDQFDSWKTLIDMYRLMSNLENKDINQITIQGIEPGNVRTYLETELPTKFANVRAELQKYFSQSILDTFKQQYDQWLATIDPAKMLAQAKEQKRQAAQQVLENLINTKLKTFPVAIDPTLVTDYKSAYEEFALNDGKDDTFKFWSIWLLFENLIKNYHEKGPDVIAPITTPNPSEVIQFLSDRFDEYKSLKGKVTVIPEAKFDDYEKDFDFYIKDLEEREELKKKLPEIEQELKQLVADARTKVSNNQMIDESAFTKLYDPYRRIMGFKGNLNYVYLNIFIDYYNVMINAKAKNLSLEQIIEENGTYYNEENLNMKLADFKNNENSKNAIIEELGQENYNKFIAEFENWIKEITKTPEQRAEDTLNSLIAKFRVNTATAQDLEQYERTLGSVDPKNKNYLTYRFWKNWVNAKKLLEAKTEDVQAINDAIKRINLVKSTDPATASAITGELETYLASIIEQQLNQIIAEKFNTENPDLSPATEATFNELIDKYDDIAKDTPSYDRYIQWARWILVSRNAQEKIQTLTDKLAGDNVSEDVEKTLNETIEKLKEIYTEIQAPNIKALQAQLSSLQDELQRKRDIAKSQADLEKYITEFKALNFNNIKEYDTALTQYQQAMGSTPLDKKYTFWKDLATNYTLSQYFDDNILVISKKLGVPRDKVTEKFLDAIDELKNLKNEATTQGFDIQNAIAKLSDKKNDLIREVHLVTDIEEKFQKGGSITKTGGLGSTLYKLDPKIGADYREYKKEYDELKLASRPGRDIYDYWNLRMSLLLKWSDKTLSTNDYNDFIKLKDLFWYTPSTDQAKLDQFDIKDKEATEYAQDILQINIRKP